MASTPEDPAEKPVRRGINPNRDPASLTLGEQAALDRPGGLRDAVYNGVPAARENQRFPGERDAVEALGRSNAPAVPLRGAPTDPNFMASGLRAYQPQAMNIQRRQPTRRESHPSDAYGWGEPAKMTQEARDTPGGSFMGNTPEQIGENVMRRTPHQQWMADGQVGPMPTAPTAPAQPGQPGMPPRFGGPQGAPSWMDRARSSSGFGGGGMRPSPGPQRPVISGNPMFAGGSPTFDETANSGPGLVSGQPRPTPPMSTPPATVPRQRAPGSAASRPGTMFGLNGPTSQGSGQPPPPQQRPTPGMAAGGTNPAPAPPRPMPQQMQPQQMQPQQRQGGLQAALRGQ